MKTPQIRALILILAALGLGAAGWLWLRPLAPPAAPAVSRAEPTTSPPVAPIPSAMVSATPSSEGSVAALVARQREWGKITNSAEADQIEIELKAQITDANAAGIVRSLPPELLETQFGLKALERWASLDRTAAVEWLSQQPAPTMFQIGAALRGWIAKDSDSVMGYVEGLPEGAWKNRVIAETSADATRNKLPLEAISLLRQMEPGDTQTRLLKDAAIAWGQADPHTASEWVEQVNDPDLQKNLISMIAIGYASKQPAAAVEWLQQSFPAGDELNRSIGDVISIWVGESRPQDAAAWVAGLPVGNLRGSAMEKLIARWREFDPDAVARWIDGLPTGEVKQQAEDQLAKTAGAVAGANGS